MSYDRSRDPYADFTDNRMNMFYPWIYTKIRTPEMKEAQSYRFIRNPAINLDPAIPYIDEARFVDSGKLSLTLDTVDIYPYLRYAVEYCRNFPGTKFWIGDSIVACDIQDENMRRRKEYIKQNPRALYVPEDATMRFDVSPSIFGVCKEGIWHIKEKYAGVIGRVIPGGVPKSFRLVA